jgi:hypothetical protein
MSRLDRVLAIASVPVGLVVAWTLYVEVVGSIGPIELLEVLLLTAPIAITTFRLLRAAVTVTRTPPRPRPAARTAGSGRRSR